MMIALICAAAQNGVIGLDNQLPWHLPADLKRFKTLTMGHTILMGRKTFESIGRPLAGRTNIVITRQAAYQADGCLIAPSLAKAIELAQPDPEIFIIGGAAIYRQALPYANRIYLTLVHAEFTGDTFLFEIDPAMWREVSREDFDPDEKNDVPYSFLVLEATKPQKQASLPATDDHS
jgi:dihydrofolate reductase